MYHYTDLNGFLSIIQNQSIWMTNARAMNDSSEVTWFNNLYTKELFGRMNKLNLSESQQAIFDSFLESSLNSELVPHICCFSKEGDLLSQWRAYADDGFGVSILFDDSGFDRIDLESYQGQFGDKTFCSDVVYDLQKHKDAARGLAERTLDATNKVSINQNDVMKNLPLQEFWDIKAKIEIYSYFCKNPAFSEEMEIRLIKLVKIKNHTLELFPQPKEKLNFRVTGGTIASYLERPFASSCIKKIILGPKCKAEIRDITTFLRRNGFQSVEVVKSIASYR